MLMILTHRHLWYMLHPIFQTSELSLIYLCIGSSATHFIQATVTPACVLGPKSDILNLDQFYFTSLPLLFGVFPFLYGLPLM